MIQAPRPALSESELAIRDAAFVALVHKKKVSRAGLSLVLAATALLFEREPAWSHASRARVERPRAIRQRWGES